MLTAPIINKLGNWLVDRIPTHISSLFVILLPSAVLLQILSRNMGVNISGLVSLSRLLSVWIIFLLVGTIAIEQKHIKIGFFVQQLPKELRKWHEGVLYIVNIIVGVILLYSAAIAAYIGMSATISGLDIPQTFYYLPAIFGFFIFTGANIHFLYRWAVSVNIIAKGGSYD